MRGSNTLSIVGFALAGVCALASATAAPPSGIDKRDLASEIIADIEAATTCAECDALLVLLQGIAALGNDAFVDAVTEVCIETGAEDPDVCTGAIGLEGPILAHDLREMTVPSHTSQLFCITLFGLCAYPPVTPFNVTFPSPKPATSRPPVSGKTPIEIVHISDIHVDLSYEVGASFNCTKNICCRPYTPADAPGNNSFPAGPFGESTCDSPRVLETSMYAAIEQIAPNAAFTMFTGDVVEGAVWLVSQTENTGDMNNAYDAMSGLKLVYGTVGNHEAAPVNSYPPTAVTTTITSQWVYDTLSSLWEQWIGSAAATTADDYGAYSILWPGGNLRIISINTNFYYKENWWLYESTMEMDPSGQLAWLVGELQAAEDAGERVFIMGHMPMGSSDVFHDTSNYFDQIIHRYDATISAVFFGHTHKDEFQISYSDYTNQIASNALMNYYIAPAMTPTSGNPTFRVYSVDPVTFAVLDFTVYIANMTSPSFQSGPTWEKYYSAKETYGSLLTPPVTAAEAELTPAFWHNVTTLFENNDPVFQEYFLRKSRGFFTANCTGTCKTGEICQLRAAQSQFNCVAITPGVDFRKRDAESATTSAHDECSGSAAGSIFKHLSQNVPVWRDSLKKRMETLVPQ